jgi:hypothetical protein
MLGGTVVFISRYDKYYISSNIQEDKNGSQEKKEKVNDV